MANELTLNAEINFLKSGVSIDHQIANLLRTIAGAQSIQNIQTIGVANEPISFGDSSPGYVVLKNLDATNYVEIFGDALDAELHDKLLTGDFVIRKLDGATPLFGKANTGACDLLVIGIDL